MRTKFIESNLPERYIHSVRNVDVGSVSSISTVFNSIAQGTPVVLTLQATPQPSTNQNGRPLGFEDGLQVVNPVSAANNTNLGSGNVQQVNFYQYGIAVGNILYAALGEVMVHGVYPFTLITRATRSASTASWSSSASVAGNQLLSIDTLNNAYTTVASGSTASSSGTFFNNPVYSIAPATLLDSLAVVAASASATSDTRTAIITAQRVFIREM